MNTDLIPQVVESIVAVQVGALLVLAVLSYVSSRYILDGLDWLDRRLSSPRDFQSSALAPEPSVESGPERTS